MKALLNMGISGLAVAGALAAPALAQTPPADAPAVTTQASDPNTAPQPATQNPQEGGLAEIVVTATRRDTNLQRTPVAVSAIDQSLIQQSSSSNLCQIGRG